MTETVEQKQSRRAKLEAQKQALLEKAKAVQKLIERDAYAAKAKSKKQDDRTKLLAGVAIIEAARKNPQVKAMLVEAVRKMPAKDQGFLLQESKLWTDLMGETKQPEEVTATPHT